MDELKEITLKVNLDSYKALQNYLHNELAISKEDIEKMLEKLIGRIINNKIEDGEFLHKSVDKIVADSIYRLENSNTWQLEKRIDQYIEKAIGEKIMKRVREQLNGVNL